MKEIISLHQHWCIAESIKKIVFDDVVKIKLNNGVVAFDGLDDIQSTFFRICAWYSLLYVVVEGWNELEIKFDDIYELLSDEKMVRGLYMFNNSCFRFSRELISSELMDFLESVDAEIWSIELHEAFNKYFYLSLTAMQRLKFIT